MTQHDLEQYFAFLDGLRCTGACNMFTACPYLVDVFDMDLEEARRVWALWANTFAINTTPEERAATALAVERAQHRTVIEQHTSQISDWSGSVSVPEP